MENQPFFGHPVKSKQETYKNLKCQETMIIKHEIYQINRIIKIIINSLTQIYQDKQIIAQQFSFIGKLEEHDGVT